MFTIYPVFGALTKSTFFHHNEVAYQKAYVQIYLWRNIPK